MHDRVEKDESGILGSINRFSVFKVFAHLNRNLERMGSPFPPAWDWVAGYTTIILSPPVHPRHDEDDNNDDQNDDENTGIKSSSKDVACQLTAG